MNKITLEIRPGTMPAVEVLGHLHSLLAEPHIVSFVAQVGEMESVEAASAYAEERSNPHVVLDMWWSGWHESLQFDLKREVEHDAAGNAVRVQILAKGQIKFAPDAEPEPEPEED